jgi:hypothetical protein
LSNYDILGKELNIDKKPSVRGSHNQSSLFKRPTNRPIKNRVNLGDSSMLRERGKIFNFDTKTRRADSKFTKHQYTPVSNRSDHGPESTFAIIEDNLRKRIKELEERTVRASKRGLTVKVFDEKRISIYIQSLRDLLDSKLMPHSLAQILIEGFEDSKQRIIIHEKNMSDMNQVLVKQVSDLENKMKSIKNEMLEIDKETRMTLTGILEEKDKLQEEKTGLLQRLFKLNEETNFYEVKSDKLQKEIDDIRQREIDRLEETDLDDVGLISEATKKKQNNRKPPHPLVPSLDFDKMRKLQEEEANKIKILNYELDENVPFEEHNKIIVDDHDEEVEE